MTVSTPAFSVTSQGNGSTTVWDYNFIIPFQADGATPASYVQLEDSLGNITPLSWGGNYTIAGIGDPNGGTVTYPLSGSPLAAGHTITIQRDLAYTQPFEVDNQAFYPHTVEQIADWLEQQIQQLAGGGVVVIPPTVGVAGLQFGTLALAQAATIPSASQFLQLMGYTASGDSPPASYAKSSAGAGAGKFQSADGAWWKLDVGGQVNVRWFGAKIDGSTDDTTAWTNALSFARANGNLVVYHPGGNSIYTGAMVLDNHSILGVDSYLNTPGQPISQTSLITFHGNNAGMTLLNDTSGGVHLEKMGFKGLPSSYSGQKGFYMADSLRSGAQSEGWPTIRDCSFGAFSTGILVEEKYQSGWIWNVYCYDSVVNGYWNQSVDWYHYMLSCGSSTVVASGYQMILGPTSPSSYSAGAHQVVGGAFFGAVNTVGIVNSFGNIITGAYIQNANGSGLVIGDASGHGVSDHLILGCLFASNNISGGANNVNGLNNYDIWLREAAREIRIQDCRFASQGVANICVAAGIGIEGPDNDSVMITGCNFNMDGIVTPASPTIPQAIIVPALILKNSLDHLLIEDNFASYGESGRYTFEQRRVDMVSLGGTTAIAATVLSIASGGVYISAAVSVTLPNPKYAGRRMTICGLSGAVFVCATSGALGSAHTQGAFTANGGYVDLISTSATTWQILGSANVTIS